MSEPLPDRLRFDGCEVRPVERELHVAGRPVPVGARAFDVLLDLLAHRERVVTKNELLDRVWAGLVVEENNLATQVSTLRKLLGPQAIATIPGRGYRFSARVAANTAVAEPETAATAATPAPGRLRTNLPGRLPPLIGRDADLATLEALVDEQAVVCVVGGGGAGKTRLAQALALGRRERYAHGVCWVDLATVTDPARLCGAVADALDVGIGGGEPLPALAAALAPLELLLVLDNAEHLLDATGTLVAAASEAAPRLRIVVTSQAPLRAAAERVFRLEDLAVPEPEVSAADALGYGAVALFVDRATAADTRFTLRDDNVGAVVAICRALHGLALALELAATRVPMLGVARLADSLDQRLRLLTQRRHRDAPARQQTLRAALEWSHGLLGAAAQAVFRRLGVLPGSASLDLLQVLARDDDASDADTDGDVLDVLSDLVDRSLVAVVPGEDDAAPLRYRLLESPRLYALERLAEAGELASARRRLVDFTARLFAEAYTTRWDGSVRVDRWRVTLQPDLDNGRAAFAWACADGDAATALTIAATLVTALPWSLQFELSAIVDAGRPFLRDEGVPGATRLHATLAVCAFARGSRALDMRGVALQGVAIARELDDRFGLYAATSYLACAEARLDHVDATEAALAEMRALEDPAWPAQRLALGADAEYLAGRTDPARVLALTRRQMTLNRAVGGNTWMALLNMVDAELGAGDPRAAAAYGEELLGQLRHSRDERGLAYALLNLTGVQLALGDAAAARALAKTGWPLGPRFDLQAYWGDVLSLLAARQGRPRQAAHLAGFADARYREHQEARLGNEAKAHDEAVAACRAALGDAAFERLRADGETLVDGDVAALAFAAADG